MPLRDAPGWLNVLLIVLLGVLAPLGSLRLRPLRALLDALAAAVVFTIATQLAFNSGLDRQPSSIRCSRWPSRTLGTLAVLYLSATIERERVHDLFSRFVPAEVVDQVVARADDNLRLGAVERDCTVLFSDLRGFTSFSEKQPAAARHRGGQLLPERDDRGDPRRRRHADRLHGRRHHGRVRRAARAGPTTPTARSRRPPR